MTGIFTIIFIILIIVIIKIRNDKLIIEELLHSIYNKNFLDHVPNKYKQDYSKTVNFILEQDLKLENSSKELSEYKEELDIACEALLKKTKELEYSNDFLKQKVASLSNLNSLSKTVLSTMDLDKIISTILDAYFVLTNTKRLSLYLWENGSLVNKKIKGDISFKKELKYSEEILANFNKKIYNHIYKQMSQEFLVSENEEILISPLNVKGKELGVIFIIEDKSSLLKNEKETIHALAIQIAIAINNAKIYSDLLVKEKMSQELDVASRIQNSILPKKIKKVLGLDIATYFKPAKEIGGDYYDYSILDGDTFSITVADVSGKGVPAAFLMALGRSILKTLELQNNPPHINLKNLNKYIYSDITEDMFITMLHSKYNYKTKTISYSNAGHTPLLMYNSLKDEIEMKKIKGMAIGFLEEYNYSLGEIKLNVGDIVMYYTDGITEAENFEKELFGMERLKKLIYDNSKGSADEMKAVILENLKEFQKGCIQNDDITFVIVKREE